MQISFIMSSLRLSGGVKAIIEITNRLIERGHSVTLVVPKETIDPKVASSLSSDAKICESTIPFSQNMTTFNKIRLAYSLAEVTPRSDFIISTHTPTTAVVFIATKLFKKGIPIWYFLDYPEMFSHRSIESWLLLNALRWHKGAIAISEFCKQTLVNSGFNIPIQVISVGISNTHIFHPKDNHEADKAIQDTIPILFLGDPRPRKGLADFLEAVKIVYLQVPNIELWIASKMDLNISSPAPYKLFTRPSDQELAQLYRDCFVFVSASWVEGFGLPPLEAMACGAPVVMTDSKGVRDYAQNEENCILTPPRNSDALSKGILKLIQNPIMVERFRRNGPTTASRFTWDVTIDAFEKILLTWM